MTRSDIWHKYHECSSIYAKYHLQIVPSFVYATTRNSFVIFTCRYFKIKLKYHCSNPIKLQKFVM